MKTVAGPGARWTHEGAPTIVYTGVQGDWSLPRNQRVCVARGTNDLISWEKHAGNPVIARAPDGLDCQRIPRSLCLARG